MNPSSRSPTVGTRAFICVWCPRFESWHSSTEWSHRFPSLPVFLLQKAKISFLWWGISKRFHLKSLMWHELINKACFVGGTAPPPPPTPPPPTPPLLYYPSPLSLSLPSYSRLDTKPQSLGIFTHAALLNVDYNQNKSCIKSPPPSPHIFLLAIMIKVHN